jgi:aryl-alcohol dehydrogenase
VRIRAAIVAERGGSFTLTDLELDDPAPDEVLIRVLGVGICRTDLHIRDQEYPVPAFPVVAGHESVGVVEAVGATVTGIAVGDRVLASYPSCGACPACKAGRNPYCAHGFALSFGGTRLDGSTALHRPDGSPVHGHVFQQSSFATHAVVHQGNLVVLPGTIEDPALLAPLACGVQTGAGAVLESLRVGPGSSIAIWGTGSVGLSAVMAAKVAGAATIVAVDTQPGRLELARELGATHTVDARRASPAHWTDLVRDGLDHGVETTGSPQVLAGALDAMAMGGELALVGAAPAGTTAAIDMGRLLNGRRLRGVIQGDAVPQDLLPRLIALHQDGRLPFDRLVTSYDFDRIEQAVADMTAGRVIKPLLRMPLP